MSMKFKFHYNLTTIMGTLHEDQYTFVIISHSVLLRMRNVADMNQIQSTLVNAAQNQIQAIKTLLVQ